MNSEGLTFLLIYLSALSTHINSFKLGNLSYVQWVENSKCTNV